MPLPTTPPAPRLSPYRPGLTIVMPAHNEAAVLEATVDRICTYFELRTERGLVELIVVDDHSTDDTWNVAWRSAVTCSFRVLANRYRRGYAGAVQTGIMAATRARLVVMTADGAEDLTALRYHLHGHDAVFGDRWLHGRPPTYPRGKYFVNRLGNWIVALGVVSGASTLPYVDWTDPYKSYPTAWLVELVPLRAVQQGLGMSAGLELALRVLRTHPTAVSRVVPVSWVERTGGVSKFRLGAAWEYC